MVWILSVGAPSISWRVERISNISDIPIAPEPNYYVLDIFHGYWGWPDLSSSYISNIHRNFSLALPDVGILEATRNSWEEYVIKPDRPLYCRNPTLKSMLPLLSSSKSVKSWSTNILAMPGGRRRQYMSKSFCLSSSPWGHCPMNPLNKGL